MRFAAPYKRTFVIIVSVIPATRSNPEPDE